MYIKCDTVKLYFSDHLKKKAFNIFLPAQKMYRASERYLTSLKEVYTIIDIVVVYTVLRRSHFFFDSVHTLITAGNSRFPSTKNRTSQVIMSF